MNNFADIRPDPDELLASLKSEEEKNRRGKLKIFFGMCAGVGKTYTMLQTAGAEKLKGCDIIIGYVETHNRKETALLADGFELIPRKSYMYKSAQVQEMDLDAIIARYLPEVAIIKDTRTCSSYSKMVSMFTLRLMFNTSKAVPKQLHKLPVLWSAKQCPTKSSRMLMK
jgi:hypothetical protein